MYDLKSWFLMPLAAEGHKLNGAPYGRDTHHLEGLNLSNNTKVYSYFNDTGRTMAFTKTPQGYPWDLKGYDSAFIYDMATELNWTSPRDFKRNAPPQAMCPRYWDGDESQYQFHAHAAYDVVQNCSPTGHGDVGPTYYTLKGPYFQDFGGDVGTVLTILLSYYWGDMHNREQLFLTSAFGWVRWTHATLQALSVHLNEYVIDVAVVHNKVVAGVLTPDFPCFPIP